MEENIAGNCVWIVRYMIIIAQVNEVGQKLFN